MIIQTVRQLRSVISTPAAGHAYLRGETRKVFFDFIQEEYPDLYPQLQAIFKTGGADKEYKNHLYLMVNELRDRYGISSSYSKPMKEKMLP